MMWDCLLNAPALFIIKCIGYHFKRVTWYILWFGSPVTDFVDGDYGKGLYFSRYASTAVHFSTVSKLNISHKYRKNIPVLLVFLTIIPHLSASRIVMA